jgi:hypothetical protein
VVAWLAGGGCVKYQWYAQLFTLSAEKLEPGFRIVINDGPEGCEFMVHLLLTQHRHATKFLLCYASCRLFTKLMIVLVVLHGRQSQCDGLDIPSYGLV